MRSPEQKEEILINSVRMLVRMLRAQQELSRGMVELIEAFAGPIPTKRLERVIKNAKKQDRDIGSFLAPIEEFLP